MSNKNDVVLKFDTFVVILVSQATISEEDLKKAIDEKLKIFVFNIKDNTLKECQIQLILTKENLMEETLMKT